MIANQEVNTILRELKRIKDYKKQLEKDEEYLKQKLYNIVQEEELISTEDGIVLATWRYTDEIRAFDAKRFKAEQEGLYNEYMSVRPGVRRLILTEELK